MTEDSDAWQLVLTETTDPEVRIRLLAFRISVLTREKEGLERRLDKLELAYTMGMGVFWAAPAIGVVMSILWYNWGWISKPWTKTAP